MVLPLWSLVCHRELMIWCWPCGEGHRCGLDSIPGPELQCVTGVAKKEKRWKNKIHKIKLWIGYCSRLYFPKLSATPVPGSHALPGCTLVTIPSKAKALTLVGFCLLWPVSSGWNHVMWLLRLGDKKLHGSLLLCRTIGAWSSAGKKTHYLAAAVMWQSWATWWQVDPSSSSDHGGFPAQPEVGK